MIDHHALDYLLLAVSVAALLAVVQETERLESPLRDWRPWRATAVFAVAVAASMLAWNGAPLPVLVPVGGSFVTVALVALGHDRPVPPAVPVLGVGFVAATALAAVPHLCWGWQERAVVVAPALAGTGTALVGAVTSLSRRRNWSLAWGTAAVTIAPVLAVLGVWLLAPTVLARFGERLSVLAFERGHVDEAQSLLAPASLVTLTPVSQFGVLLVWGGPGIAWLLAHGVRRDRRDWDLMATVGAVLGGLAVFQLRFAGEWVVVLPVVAAVGLFDHLSRMGLCASPLDEGRQRLSAPAPAGVLILVLVLSIGLVVSVYTAGAVAVDDDRAAAAAWLDEHAAGEQVLSKWDTYRLYNYHASGDGRSYRFALDAFAAVVGGDRPPPGNVSYVVVERDRLPSGYAADWHVGEATRVWQRGDITIWRVDR